MNENSTTGASGTSGLGTGTSGNGGRSPQDSAGEAKEHLRAAKDAATEAARGAAQQARGWARTKMTGLQEQVEAEPYRATAWALGIGFVAGVLLTALARSGRR